MKLSLPFEVLYIAYTLQDAGFEAFLVGGAIRDIILQSTDSFYHQHLSITDYDFTTNAKPEEILKLFPESFYENTFGTVSITHTHTLELIMKHWDLPNKNLLTASQAKNQKKLLIKPENAHKVHQSLSPSRQLEEITLPSEEKQPKPFEITTYRTDGDYQDHRRPESVQWGKTIEEDLERRDFSINAMALRIDAEFLKKVFSAKKLTDTYLLNLEGFTLIDPHGGIKDLAQGLIEAVGDPNVRFKEDALRMLRAIRFSVQLGMKIADSTLEAIKVHAPLIQHVSWERIRDEFLKMLASPAPKKAIELLDTTNILQYILPELLESKGVQQGGHHTTDVWVHSLDALETCPSEDPIVRLATLIHDVAKPRTYQKTGDAISFYNHEIIGSRMASTIAKRLKLSKKDIERVFILVRHHMFHYQPENTDAAIRRFMKKVGLGNIDDILDLREGDRLGSGAKKTSWRLEEMKERMIKQLNQPMEVRDLAINGHDLMTDLQMKPGREMGQILNTLFEEVLENPEINTREILLQKAKAMIAE